MFLIHKNLWPGDAPGPPQRLSARHKEAARHDPSPEFVPTPQTTPPARMGVGGEALADRPFNRLVSLPHSPVGFWMCTHNVHWTVDDERDPRSSL